MPYVMVPVPEEYEQEMMSELLRISLRKSVEVWAPEPLMAVHAACDPEERTLVYELTRASAEGRSLSFSALEDALHVSSDALEALVSGVNERCETHSLPWLIEREPAGATSDSADSETSDLLLIAAPAALALTANGIVDLPDR